MTPPKCYHGSGLYRVLQYTAAHGPVPGHELCGQLHLQPATLTTYLRRAVKSGLLARHESGGYTITPDGLHWLTHAPPRPALRGWAATLGLLLCLTLTGCADLLSPLVGHPWRPVTHVPVDALILDTWKTMESCLGMKKRIGSTTFWAVPGIPGDELGIRYKGQDLYGLYRSGVERIYLSDSLWALIRTRTVAPVTLQHEIAHAITGHATHPAHIFTDGPCGNLWGQRATHP